MRSPRRYALGDSCGRRCWGVRDWYLPDTVHFAPWWKAIPERLAYEVWIRLLWLRLGLGLSHHEPGTALPPLLRLWTNPWIEFRWRWGHYRKPSPGKPPYPRFILRYTPLGGYWWGIMLRGI